MLFIGARQPGQQGRQSYADHIEGLHYLEAGYFLFSLKGRVRESISLAKESDGEQKAGRAWGGGGVQGGEKSVCMRERGNELQRECVSAGYTGEQGQITPEQHLCDCTVALC